MRIPSASRLAVPLLLSASLAACGGGDAPSRQSPEVTVATLKSQTVTLTRELPGRTSPFLVAEVRPQVDGIIEKRLFTEGGLVKAGEALYRIDDASYRADHGAAPANVTTANDRTSGGKGNGVSVHVDLGGRRIH